MRGRWDVSIAGQDNVNRQQERFRLRVFFVSKARFLLFLALHLYNHGTINDIKTSH